MVDIDVVLDAIVLGLQNLPDVVTAMNDSKQAILKYEPSLPDTPDLEHAIQNMGIPEILVAHKETGIVDRGDLPVWGHTFEVYIKLPGGSPAGSYMSIFHKIMNGRTSEGIEYQFSSIVQDCDPMRDMVFSRNADPGNAIDYYVLSFVLVDLGT